MWAEGRRRARGTWVAIHVCVAMKRFALGLALALSFASAACTGGGRTMKPPVAAAAAEERAETSCAGAVCFTYADDR
jgi:hypothetical protein